MIDVKSNWMALENGESQRIFEQVMDNARKRVSQEKRQSRRADKPAPITPTGIKLSTEEYFLHCAGIIRQHGSLEEFDAKLDWYKQNSEDQP